MYTIIFEFMLKNNSRRHVDRRRCRRSAWGHRRGLYGSTPERDSGNNAIMRTTSVTLIFESPVLAYATKVSRDQVEEAQAFVDAVKGAAGRRR